MTHPGPDSAAQPQPEESDTQGRPFAGQEHGGSTTAVQQVEPPVETVPAEPASLWQRRRPLLVGIAVAVVVLVGAGVGTAVALNRSSDAPGSASPQDAATKLLTDVGNDDLLGVVNDLPTNEAAILQTTMNGLTSQLKKVDVIKPNVNTQGLTGLDIKTSGIQFGSDVRQVNDHIAVASLVAGTITIGTKVATNNYTQSFLQAAFPGGVTGNGTNVTMNIAQIVKQQGHPVGIATVQQGGRWYPSLFYSIADGALQASHQQWPATALPARGADVPNEAVEDAMQEVLDGDTKTVLERMSTAEMPVLHDVGQVLADATAGKPNGVLIGPITFDDVHVPGGVDAVLNKMTLTAKNGQKTVVTHVNGCYTVQAGGKQSQFCAGDFAKQLRANPVSQAVPPAVLTFFDDMFSGPVSKGLGIVTTESRESWYINPGLTFTHLTQDMYSSLTEQDVVGMVKASQGH
jgi:hypothetical protein